MAETIRGYPRTYRMLTASGIYWRINLAMAIPVLFGVYRAGSPAVGIAVVAIVTALLVDLVLSLLTGRGESSEVSYGRDLSIGLFVVAMSGVEGGPLFAGTASALAILVGVRLVGGAGRAWLHPAIVGLAITGTIMPDRIAGSHIAGISESGGRIVGVVAEFVGRTVFEPLAVRIPVDIWERLTSMDAVPGGAIVTAAIPLILLASLIVYGEDLVPPFVPVLVFGSFVFGVWMLGGEPLTALIDGTVLFAIVFGPVEPSTRPRSPLGAAVFALLLGTLLAVFTVNTATAMPIVAAFMIAGSLVPLLSTVRVGRR